MCPQPARQYWGHLAYRTKWMRRIVKQWYKVGPGFSRVSLGTCVLHRYLWLSQGHVQPEAFPRGRSLILLAWPGYMKERKGDEVGDGSKMVEPGVAWAGAQAFCWHHLLQKMDEFYVILWSVSPKHLLVLFPKHRKGRVCYVSLQFWEFPAASWEQAQEAVEKAVCQRWKVGGAKALLQSFFLPNIHSLPLVRSTNSQSVQMTIIHLSPNPTKTV